MLSLVLLTVAAQERLEESRPAMGTLFSIVVYAQDAAAGRAAMEQAFAKAALLEATLSDYQPQSELNQISRQAVRRPVRVSEDLFQVLAYSQRIAKESGGAFDVTVGPLTHLWREARRANLAPPEERVVQARAKVGWRKLRLNARNRTVRFAESGMQLDLGGIAKGYAAEAMLRILQRAGFPQALVSAGGDLAIGAAPPGRAAWRVAIDNGVDRPEARDLSNAFVSTAGDREQFFEINGRRYSHILDPRTGRSPDHRCAATVIAYTGWEADGLDTPLCLLDERGRKRLLRRHRLAEARVAAISTTASY